MARCISCGRKLTSEKSLICGIGSECRKRARKAGTMSKNGNRWRRRIERTIGFEKGSFVIGHTQYRKENGKWFDDSHEYEEQELRNWLEKNWQIIKPMEVTDNIYELIKQGKSIEEIISQTLDKIE